MFYYISTIHVDLSRVNICSDSITEMGKTVTHYFNTRPFCEIKKLITLVFNPHNLILMHDTKSHNKYI